MLDSILVPLDGSPLAARSLIVIEDMLRRRRSCGEPPPHVRLVRAAEATEISQACAELARTREAMGPAAEARVIEGDAGDAVLRSIQEARPSMVVMASHGRGGLDRWLRGSIAERVMRECPVPLLVANPWALERTNAAGARPFERILVPLDGSDRAGTVLPAVADVARDFGCTVILLHVLATDRSEEEALEYLDGCRSRLGGVHVEVSVVRGRPAPAILDAVRSLRADMIAIATHGRTGDPRWFYGSVAEHVLHESACPLLVVRTGAFRESMAESREVVQGAASALDARGGASCSTGS